MATSPTQKIRTSEPACSAAQKRGQQALRHCSHGCKYNWLELSGALLEILRGAAAHSRQPHELRYGARVPENLTRRPMKKGNRRKPPLYCTSAVLHYQQQPRATTALKGAGRTRKRAETRRWVSWLFSEERATAKVFFTRQRYSAGFGKPANTTAGCRNNSATTRFTCSLFSDDVASAAALPTRHKKGRTLGPCLSKQTKVPKSVYCTS